LPHFLFLHLCTFDSKANVCWSENTPNFSAFLAESAFLRSFSSETRVPSVALLELLFPEVTLRPGKNHFPFPVFPNLEMIIART